MKPTLRTIANELNLSTSLVSQVLNDKPGVWASEETRKRVLDTARAVNYRPSASARALVTGRTMQIAVALQMQSNPGFTHSHYISGLIETAGQRGYRVVTVPLRGTTGVQQIEDLVSENVCDGIAIFSAPGDADYWRALRARRTPTVVIGDAIEEKGDSVQFAVRVDHDNYCVGQSAAAWMLDAGHTRLAWAYALGEADQPHSRELRRGYEDSVRARGLEPIFLQTGTETPEEAVQNQLDTALEQNVDAVVVRWLPAVLLWLRTMRERAIKPQQLSLMALIECNNAWYLQQAGYEQDLSCLTWNDGAVGQRAAHALIDWIEKGAPDDHSISISPHCAAQLKDIVSPHC